MVRFFYLCCACLLVPAAAFGQSAKEQLAIANSAKLVSKGFYEELPFQDKLGYFILKARIDTATYEYIFDTRFSTACTGSCLALTWRWPAHRRR